MDQSAESGTHVSAHSFPIGFYQDALAAKIRGMVVRLRCAVVQRSVRIDPPFDPENLESDLLVERRVEANDQQRNTL